MNESPEDTAMLYVLDQLEPRERALVEARLTREPALAALVRDYEAALAAGIGSLPPRTPSAAVLDRLEERIDELEAREIEASRLPRHPWVTLAQWGLAAVITVSLATLAVQSLRRSNAQPVFVVVGLDANRNTFAELPPHGAAKDADARFIQLASTAENLWRNPAARPLPATTTNAGNHGYAVFDPGSQQGFIAIEQLPALAGNQRYHLWVVDAPTGRIRDAGILPLAGLNRGLYSFALEPGNTPPADGTRPNFFITVEDAAATTPSAPQPHGRVVMGKDSI
jgi:hypothetical protein